MEDYNINLEDFTTDNEIQELFTKYNFLKEERKKKEKILTQQKHELNLLKKQESKVLHKYENLKNKYSEIVLNRKGLHNKLKSYFFESIMKNEKLLIENSKVNFYKQLNFKGILDNLKSKKAKSVDYNFIYQINTTKKESTETEMINYELKEINKKKKDIYKEILLKQLEKDKIEKREIQNKLNEISIEEESLKDYLHNNPDFLID